MPAADLQFRLLGPKIPCHNRSSIEIASEGEAARIVETEWKKKNRKNESRREMEAERNEERESTNERFDRGVYRLFQSHFTDTQVACQIKIGPLQSFPGSIWFRGGIGYNVWPSPRASSKGPTISTRPLDPRFASYSTGFPLFPFPFDSFRRFRRREERSL